MLLTDSESSAMLSMNSQHMNMSDSIQADGKAETFSKCTEKKIGLILLYYLILKKKNKQMS